MGLISKLISLYASYGLVQLVVKLLRKIVQKRRMMKMIEGIIPRARYEQSMLGCIPEMVKNMHRRHDWATNVSLGFPMSYSEVGPRFDPNNLEIMVRDPAVIKHFLKDNFENYTKPENDAFWDTLRLWLGQGIFVASHGVGSPDQGSNWQRQRKIASNIFSRGNFNENMNDIFVAKGKRLCDLLKEPAAKGESVDMQAKFFQYTMDSIMKIFFGESADTMGGEPNQYGTAYDTAHRCLIDYFFNNIPALSLMQLLPWPFGGIQGLAWKLHGRSNPLFREFEASYKILDSESRRIIEACRKDANLDQRKDLLALFVQAEKSESAKDVQPQAGKHSSTGVSAPMTEEFLRDVVLNMVIAGRDTTACTLSWMFYILATNPEIQKKLHKEVDAKFQAGRAPTIKSVSPSEMPYLHGVLYEALRLYPPVPIDGKQAIEDDILPNGTKIPAGSKMTFMVYAIGRDPTVYPDPEVVKPERWIPFKEPAPHEFPVFQAGPRICLGQNMALFEAKIAAMMVLREYSFDMKPGEAEKITYLATSLTMSILNTKGNTDARLDTHNLWLTPHLRTQLTDEE